MLLTDLLVGWPFESSVDRSVALAAILTAVLRGAFDVVPMNLLRAPDVGSKSYLVDLISTVARAWPGHHQREVGRGDGEAPGRAGARRRADDLARQLLG
jgi:hypothetical protein